MEANTTINPMGTDGFEFLEFTTTDPQDLADKFTRLGFAAIAKHRSKDVTLYRQGDINFLLNAQQDSFAHAYSKRHGSSACAIGLRVKDASQAFNRAMEHGAQAIEEKVGPMEINIPGVYGVGDSLLYFIDRYGDQSIYDIDFEPIDDVEQQPKGLGLTYIDHLTYNVHRGSMDQWADFFIKIFNFKELHFFDIEGNVTGLKSRALCSPCGKIRIPINESSDDKSQIEEFIQLFRGVGIQHIALGTDDIYDSVESLRENSIEFMSVPDTYYEKVDSRVPWNQEDIARLCKNSILIDGTKQQDGGLLLQIFTENLLGPVFFEIIQRKGNQGFGEGNFQALFESIEREQMARGALDEDKSS